jgi:hypothetical protein
MKKSALVFIAVLLTVSGFAQKTADIGIWGGASTYWGDMTKVYYNQSVNPMYGAFFRYNFNARYGIRMMYMTGNMSAVGKMENADWDFGIDQVKRVHDFSLMVEINYLKYILGLKKTPFSPYIMAGFGVMYYPYILDPAAISQFNPIHNKGQILVNQSVMAPTLPLGMGIKTHIGKRFGIGVELLMRKIFNDKLDNLDDPLAHFNSEGKEITYTDYVHNNDYTAYLGINLTYKIFLGKEICPAYESKN